MSLSQQYKPEQKHTHTHTRTHKLKNQGKLHENPTTFANLRFEHMYSMGIL